MLATASRCVVTLRELSATFAMPGARVRVSGRFVMESEALGFRGIVRFD